MKTSRNTSSAIRSRHSKIARAEPSRDEVPERATDMGKEKQTPSNYAVNRTRLSRMLANPDVKRWHDNLARSSKITAEVWVRMLGRFCERHHMTPMQLGELAIRDARTAADLLEDHVSAMESEGRSPGYVECHITVVKSWFRHFDVEIRRKIRVTNPHLTPTLRDERVPDGPEMAEIYGRAGMRESVIISLMAKSGLRPEVMGNHDGTDGLRMRDLPDIVIHRGLAVCTSQPNRILVRAELSKARHQYFTFTTTQATKQLLAYLNDRLARGEPLGGDAPVIAPDKSCRNRGGNAGKAFLPTRQISKQIRTVFRPRFAWRPYVLRAYFDTQLLIAESKGRIAHDFRVFFMGHRGSIEARYTTNKSVLPESLLREMRDAFLRAERHLDLEIGTDDAEAKKKLEMQRAVEAATPEQLGTMLEAMRTIIAGKMCQASA